VLTLIRAAFTSNQTLPARVPAADGERP